MCHRCSFKVNDFYTFRINCVKAQEIFENKLSRLTYKSLSTVSKTIKYNNLLQPDFLLLTLKESFRLFKPAVILLDGSLCLVESC